MKQSSSCALGITCLLLASGCSSGSSASGGTGGQGMGHSGAGGGISSGGNAGSHLGGYGGGDPLGHAGSGAGGLAPGAGGQAGSGVGGTSGAGTGGSAPQGGGPQQTECGPLSGNWQCDHGVVHRPTPGTCEIHLPADVGSSGSDDDACEKNADCTAQANGYCALTSGLRGPMNRCVYPCTTDGDCDASRVCRCGAVGGTCAPASCKSDAECDGRYCAEYNFAPSIFTPAFACQTANDECATDADCRNKVPSTPSSFCGFNGTQRVCVPPVNVGPGAN
jgi:hypothetical protein